MLRAGGRPARSGTQRRGLGHDFSTSEDGPGIQRRASDIWKEGSRTVTRTWQFGLPSNWRLESMKAFVRQDCSARLARARLRQSGPIGMEFKAGVLIMYRTAEGELASASRALRWIEPQSAVDLSSGEWWRVEKHAATDGGRRSRCDWHAVYRVRHVPMKLKSRLALGNQKRQEVRSDSPTADSEGIQLVFSFASSRKAKVQSGDLESAHFTDERMSHVLLFRQPRSGWPGLKRPLVGTRTCVWNTECKARIPEVPPHIAWRRCLRNLTVDVKLGIVATHQPHRAAPDLVERVRVELLLLWQGTSSRRRRRLICGVRGNHSDVRFEGHVHRRQAHEARKATPDRCNGWGPRCAS